MTQTNEATARRAEQTIAELKADAAAARFQQAHPPPEEIKVLLPCTGRNERAFAKETGDIIGPLNVSFIHNERTVEVFDEPVPTDADEDKLDRNKLAKGGLKFRTLQGNRVRGWIEQFLTTGVLRKKLAQDGKPAKDEQDRLIWEFAEKTMDEGLGRALVVNPFFQKRMPTVMRILPVPVPILLPSGGIVMPKPGYNKDLNVYCALDAPPIKELDNIDEALAILEDLHRGFQFRDEQSRAHTYARFLTPFFRGIIGYSEPVPAWLFNANRPRCGKDYLAGITQIVYEGFAFEDAAIGDEPEETRKRITAGLLAGRRFFHFANCQGYLEDRYFIQAITDMVWRDRLLGSNDAASDLLMGNESEYSLSANEGLTYRDDIEPRLRIINLVFYEEDANSRIFPVEDLHGWVSARRSLALSAAYTIFKYWVKRGRPLGHPFSSYKRWGQIIGGVMHVAVLGDPTKPHEGLSLFSGDLKTQAMRAVYELCFEEYGTEWISKKDLFYTVVVNQEQDDRLLYFGDLSNQEKRKAQMKLGKTISLFEKRILNNLTMHIDDSNKKSQQWRIRFQKT
jgi:hypothetical protein